MAKACSRGIVHTCVSGASEKNVPPHLLSFFHAPPPSPEFNDGKNREKRRIQKGTFFSRRLMLRFLPTLIRGGRGSLIAVSVRSRGGTFFSLAPDSSYHVSDLSSPPSRRISERVGCSGHESRCGFGGCMAVHLPFVTTATSARV